MIKSTSHFFAEDIGSSTWQLTVDPNPSARGSNVRFWAPGMRMVFRRIHSSKTFIKFKKGMNKLVHTGIWERLIRPLAGQGK